MPESALSAELWPMLVAKAVCKLVRPAWNIQSETGLGQLSLVNLLTGWAPEHVPICSANTSVVLQTLDRLCHQPVTQDELEPLPQSTTASTVEAVAADNASVISGSEHAETGNKKSPKKKGTTSRATAAPSTTSASSAVPPTPAPAPARGTPSDTLLVLASCSAESLRAFLGSQNSLGQEDNLALGLRPGLAHTMRVLTCSHVPAAVVATCPQGVEPNLDEWVVELESPLSLFTGRLGYQDSTRAWKTAHSVALKISQEVVCSVQSASLACHAAGQGHAAFRFHMFLKDFCCVFNRLTVLHRLDEMPHHFILSSTVQPARQLRLRPFHSIVRMYIRSSSS